MNIQDQLARISIRAFTSQMIVNLYKTSPLMNVMIQNVDDYAPIDPPKPKLSDFINQALIEPWENPPTSTQRKQRFWTQYYKRYWAKKYG
jgi:hypothetical protein